MHSRCIRRNCLAGGRPQCSGGRRQAAHGDRPARLRWGTRLGDCKFQAWQRWPGTSTHSPFFLVRLACPRDFCLMGTRQRTAPLPIAHAVCLPPSASWLAGWVFCLHAERRLAHPAPPLTTANSLSWSTLIEKKKKLGTPAMPARRGGSKKLSRHRSVGCLPSALHS